MSAIFPHLFELILAFVLSISQILAIDARKKAIFNDFFFIVDMFCVRSVFRKMSEWIWIDRFRFIKNATLS